MNSEIDWEIFDSLRDSNNSNDNKNSSCGLNFEQVKNKNQNKIECKHLNTSLINYYNVCTDCGVVVSESNYEDSSFEEYKDVKYTGASKISRMCDWYKYSNKEKSDYNLKQHVIEMCRILEINYEVSEHIASDVIHTVNCIKQREGIRRSRSTDAIIVLCIHSYIHSFNIKMLMKKFKLTSRQITKAERSISEIKSGASIENNKSVKQIVADLSITLSLNNAILDKINKIVDICDMYDLIIKHSPQTIALVCIKFITENNNDELSKIFDISQATIQKAYIELKSELARIESKLSNM